MPLHHPRREMQLTDAGAPRICKAVLIGGCLTLVWQQQQQEIRALSSSETKRLAEFLEKYKKDNR